MILLSFVFVTFLVVPSLQLGAPVGPPGKLDIKKIEKCPKSNSAITINMGTDDKGQKVFNGQAQLTEDFDKKYTIQLIVSKWSGSEWKNNVMKYDGPFCDYINKGLPDVRKKIYAAAKVPGNCNIKKGKYEVKNIYATEKDVKVSPIPYGTFRIEVQVFNPKKKAILCYNIDIDSSQK